MTSEHPPLPPELEQPEQEAPSPQEEAAPAEPSAPEPSAPDQLSDSPEAGGDVDPDEALAAFEGYESLDEELAGDASEAAAAASESDARQTPKERQLVSMRLEAKVEAIVFASQKPLRVQDVLDTLADPGLTAEDVQRTLDDLVEFYQDRCGGFRLHYLKRLGYQFQTSESAGQIMERMFASRPRPISRAALETLAIIAYRQPVTRAEVEFIRGVDAGSIFKTLLERELIKCVGRKEIVGRPMIFGTSDQFLTVFNLSSIKDLPTLESFQPSRDMVQGANERIGEGGVDELVDLEDYIADNTAGEYEGDDLELTPELSPELSPEPSVDSEPLTRAVGATAKDEGEAHGTDADSEIPGTTGSGVPPGSGDLDH